jgi:hypothetical protein
MTAARARRERHRDHRAAEQPSTQERCPHAHTTTAALRNGRMIQAETEPAEIPIKKTAQVVLRFKYDGLGLGTLAFNNVSGIGRAGTGARGLACLE